MRILFLSPESPCGDAFGGRLRARQLGRALSEIGDVTVMVVGSSDEEEGCGGDGYDEFRMESRVKAVECPNVSAVQKLRRLFDVRYTNVHGCVAAEADREHIGAVMSQYDLVWVLNSRTANILGIWRWPNGHLDVDDVPSSYFQTVFKGGERRGERWKAGVQGALLHRREMMFRRRFRTLSVCSEADRVYLGGGDQIHVIPNGFERPAGEALRRAAVEPARIGFIGLCSYEPNRDGVRWFLERCWPAIRREMPGIRFRLAGRGSEEFLNWEGVDALGWIGDAAAEMATWSAMVIPIRRGGGTRVKLADAFSRKCPVVSTGVGAFGYEVEDRRELLIADEAGEFAGACVALAREPARGAEMAERAHAAFLEKWTWEAIAPRVWAAAEDCVRRSRLI